MVTICTHFQLSSCSIRSKLIIRVLWTCCSLAVNVAIKWSPDGLSMWTHTRVAVQRENLFLLLINSSPKSSQNGHMQVQYLNHKLCCHNSGACHVPSRVIPCVVPLTLGFRERKEKERNRRRVITSRPTKQITTRWKSKKSSILCTWNNCCVWTYTTC